MPQNCIHLLVIIYFVPIQPSTKGMVNGMGQALAAVGRSLGPVVSAPIFAWSETTGETIIIIFVTVEYCASAIAGHRLKLVHCYYSDCVGTIVNRTGLWLLSIIIGLLIEQVHAQ